MKKYLHIANNYLIDWVSIPGDTISLVEQPNIIEVETDTPDEEILATWHWDTTTQKIETHIIQPYYHSWDKETLTWKPNLIELQAELIKKIKKLRDTKDDEIIIYNNLHFQVATKDRENITGRIGVLKAEIELGVPENPAAYFWRDVANVVHTWPNRTDYLAWLQGLMIAYGNRRSFIYVRSWQHGAAIKAIMDDTNLTNEQKLNSLLSYDITTGW